VSSARGAPTSAESNLTAGRCPLLSGLCYSKNPPPGAYRLTGNSANLRFLIGELGTRRTKVRVDSAGIVDVATPWAAGICSFAISLFFLNKYDEEHSAHIADVQASAFDEMPPRAKAVGDPPRHNIYPYFDSPPMAYLQVNEIAALRWLENAFPISPSPRLVDWAEVLRDLSAAAGPGGENECESMIESIRQRGYFEGGRTSGGMFRGSITPAGQETLRALEAEGARRRAEGSFAKKLARYVAVQSGPILVQAIVGIVIGALIGWITGTLQTALLTGLASATAAGRVPQVRV